MEMGQNRPLCVVAGAGPGNGMAFGRRFLSAGYQVVLLARNPQMLQPLIKAVPDAGAMTALACDLTDLASIAATFDQLQAEMGSVDTLLYNAGSGLLDNIDSFDAASFEQEWRINQLGLLQTAQQVLPGMRQRQSGNIIVTGATASWRGTANFMSFAAAKAGQRSLAQSLAKKLMPEGIHVAYIIVDGVIETPATRSFLPNQPGEFFLQPDAVAETVFQLTRQPRNAWTFEQDLRPFCEKW